MTPADRKKILISLSRTIWTILQETPGLGAVATSLETSYDDLTKSKRITIAMVVDAYEKARGSAYGQSETTETATVIEATYPAATAENPPLNTAEAIILTEIREAFAGKADTFAPGETESDT